MMRILMNCNKKMISYVKIEDILKKDQGAVI